MVSEQLHGVLCYLSGRSSKVDGGGGGQGSVCVCLRPRCEHDPSQEYSVGTYYIHGTVTAMVLDETGWTDRGQGDIEHLLERRLLLSELTQQPVEYRLLDDGRNYCEFYFFPV